MDIESVVAEFEGHLANQLAIAQQAGDVSVDALIAAMRPALHNMTMGIAAQAMDELRPQIPEYDLELVVTDRQPELRARPAPPELEAADDDTEARLTLRLPTSLKSVIEQAAAEAGDSLNSFVVKSLSTRSRRGQGRGRRFVGTLRT